MAYTDETTFVLLLVPGPGGGTERLPPRWLRLAFRNDDLRGAPKVLAGFKNDDFVWPSRSPPGQVSASCTPTMPELPPR